MPDQGYNTFCMNVLEIKNLTKKYPSFLLDDISFSVKAGHIVGFIGRNGAGKTTTIKSIIGMAKPDAGELFFNDENVRENEKVFKNNVGILLGAFDCYPTKTIRQVTEATKVFYDHWDENVYRGFLSDFGLDENKQIRALSSGMQVKYGLCLALSHGAKLLILDEPTSGLDPVSRDELLDTFITLAKEQGVAILFSTHVISDLEKCADDIVYIQKGKIIADTDVETFEKGYVHISGPSEACSHLASSCIFVRDRLGRFEGVCPSSRRPEPIEGAEIRPATLEEIMIAFERGDHDE